VNWLEEGFDYDLAANRRWLDYLSDKGFPGKTEAVFRHIIFALRVWSDRCGGDNKLTEADDPAEALASLYETWRRLLDTLPLETEISYHNSRGVAGRRHLHQIARHVIDHGTYHRGQLRQMAEEAGFDDWPDFGFVSYLIEEYGSGV